MEYFDQKVFEKTAQKLKLKKHNITPAKEILESLDAGVFNILFVAGVGCGKSYVIKTIIEMFPNAKFLYIVPKWSVVDYLKEDAGYGKYKERISYTTYNSFSDKEKGRQNLEGYDFVVADEAHHIGSDMYGNVIAKLMKEHISRFIGLTATPVRDDKTNVAGYFEKTIKGLTNFEAIEQGLMPKFEYLICMPEINKEDFKGDKINFNIDYDNSDDFLFDIVQDNPRNKWICFFRTIKDLKRHIPLIERILPDHTIIQIHSYSDEEQTEALKRVRECEKCVILSVDCLLEGIHIDSVDGIFFFRNVQSVTVFMQCLGRVSQIGKKTEPLVIDCTKTAFKILSKLLAQEGNSLTSVFNGNGMHHKIVNVTLKNTKYYDVMKTLFLMSAYGQNAFEYENVLYSSFSECCRAYNINAQNASEYRLRHNMTQKEVLDFFRTNGISSCGELHSFFFRGKDYETLRNCCENFGVSYRYIMVLKGKHPELSYQEILEQKVDGKTFLVNGINYKSVNFFCKKMHIGWETIRKKADSLGISDEKAAELLISEGKGVFIFHKKEYKSFNKACSENGTNPSEVKMTAKNKNLSLQEALDAVIQQNKEKKRPASPFPFHGVLYKNYTECIQKLEISNGSVNFQMKKGLTREEALEMIYKKKQVL